MSEVRFELSRHDVDAASGFDLGYIQVTGDPASASSAGQTPSQSMMIYLSLVMLLDGLSGLSKASSGSYRFIAVGSSFRLDFVMSRAGRLTIMGRRGTPIAQTTLATCLASVRAAVERFLGVPENQLSPDDPVAGDLREARQTFDAAVRGAAR